MTNALFDRLEKLMPELAHGFRADAPLSGLTWFRVGGPVELLFRPENALALSEFLKALPADVPYMAIGAGSNLLARDGGLKGVAIRLGAGFMNIEVLEGERLRVGAGAADQAVADAALGFEISGFEFLSGIPGTIGGALRMNAGAFGGEMKDVVLGVEALDPKGGLHFLDPAHLDFSYRRCGAPEDWIFTSALLQGRTGQKANIARRMKEIHQARESAQPIHGRTGGSTFANPEGGQAWKLIEDAGCRGLRIGDAEVSTLHCNFLLNLGRATAADIEALGEEVQKRVKANSGVSLTWEIRRIGEKETGR